MNHRIAITSRHDHRSIGALRLEPAGARKGGIVLLQEIFGLDAYMRCDAERWARLGYEVIAPSLFDRCEQDYAAAHDEHGIATGMRHLKATPDVQALGDIAACVDLLAPSGPVFVLGYCYGGRLAWLAASQLKGIAAAVTYYGNVLPHMGDTPRCPVMMHFGGQDPHLPVSEIAKAVRDTHPDVALHIYPQAGHGFNNEGASDADGADRKVARDMTVAFLARQQPGESKAP